MSVDGEQFDVVDPLDDFSFRVAWTYNDAYAQFIVVEPASIDEDGPLYWRKGKDAAHDNPSHEIDDAIPYLAGTIKWDGCSHFYFGEEGYVHFCGLATFKKHNDLMRFLYNRAFDLMRPQTTLDGEGKWE